MKRHEQTEDGSSNPLTSGPHLVLPYKDKTILDDAANLLIHHVKRQTGIQKQEKARIKHILRQFVPDLFFAPRQQLSDDEREEDDRDMDVDQEHEDENKSSSKNGNKNNGSSNLTSSTSAGGNGSGSATEKDAFASAIKEETPDSTTAGSKPTTSATASSSSPENAMTLPGTTATSSGTTGQPTSTASGVDSSSTSGANRSSTEDSGKENLPDSAIKVEIKQEHDPDQPTGSAGQTTSGAQQQPSTNPPLPAHAISKHYEEAYTLFFTNNNWYLFLRLHAILCERLRTIYERAQIIATEERMYQSSRNNSTATALRLKPKSEIKVEDFYSTFLDMLKNVLDGNMEASNFEDSLREMFGIHAYIAFTLDRVVQNAVRQLQHCVTERGALECVELFQLEQRKGGAGGLCRTANRRVAHELAYQRKAEAALQDENCFKVYIYKIDCKVTIELLDTESDDTAQNFNNAQNYSNYVDRLSNPAATGTGSESGASITGVTTGGAGNVEIKTEKPDDDLAYSSANRKARFLQRNLRRCKAASSPQTEELQADSSPKDERDSKSPLSGGGTTTGQKLNNIASQSAEGGPNNNNNNTLKKGDAATEVSTAVWNHKGKTNQAPERLPSSNGDQSYYVDDREQFRLSMNNNKISFVLNKHHIFYKRKSLLRARETHPTVTKTMHHRFDAFVQRWLDQNVSEAQRTQCNEWLLGTRLDLVKNLTVVRQNNDISRTPYMPYNRYKVEKVDHL